jgi:hypothetical protein
MHIHLTELPVGALIFLGVLAAVQVTLDAIALVDLARRPAQSVTLPSKWIWVGIILLVSLFGAILYFAIGRKPTTAAALDFGRPSPQTRSAAEIADALYGKNDETPQS